MKPFTLITKSDNLCIGDEHMPAKLPLPNKEQFEIDAGCMRTYQLKKKYGVSLNTIKLWKRIFGLSNVGVKGVRRITWEVASNGCWNCTSHKPNASGYPQGSYKLGRRSIARVIFERERGPIEEGLVLRHKCDNPLCVNPNHLEKGTAGENARDRDERGRTAKGEDAGQAKLTWDQVRSIRAMKGKLSQRKVGQLFGVSGVAVWNIWMNRTWKESGD